MRILVIIALICAQSAFAQRNPVKIINDAITAVKVVKRTYGTYNRVQKHLNKPGYENNLSSVPRKKYVGYDIARVSEGAEYGNKILRQNSKPVKVEFNHDFLKIKFPFKRPKVTPLEHNLKKYPVVKIQSNAK